MSAYCVGWAVARSPWIWFFESFKTPLKLETLKLWKFQNTFETWKFQHAFETWNSERFKTHLKLLKVSTHFWNLKLWSFDTFPLIYFETWKFETLKLSLDIFWNVDFETLKLWNCQRYQILLHSVRFCRLPDCRPPESVDSQNVRTALRNRWSEIL